MISAKNPTSAIRQPFRILNLRNHDTATQVRSGAEWGSSTSETYTNSPRSASTAWQARMDLLQRARPAWRRKADCGILALPRAGGEPSEFADARGRTEWLERGSWEQHRF